MKQQLDGHQLGSGETTCDRALNHMVLARCSASGAPHLQGKELQEASPLGAQGLEPDLLSSRCFLSVSRHDMVKMGASACLPARAAGV